MLLVLRPEVPWTVGVASFGVAGLGMGLAYSPLALIVLRESSPENQGAATSSLSLTDSLGTAVGTGLTGAMVAASVRSTGDPLAGLTVGLHHRRRDRLRWAAADRSPAPADGTRGGPRPVLRHAALVGRTRRHRRGRAERLR